MEKETTNITLRKDIKIRSQEAVKQGRFPGINNLSALIELALEELLKGGC